MSQKKQSPNESHAIPDFVLNPDPMRYMGDNYLVLDFETEVNDGRFGSAIDRRNHLALACWSRGPRGRVSHHWGGEHGQPDLCNDIQALVDTGGFLVAHNAKYELGWLTRAGVDISKLLCFDTKLAEYVLLGNLAAGDMDTGVRRVSTSLDDCCLRRGWLPKDRIVDLWMKHGIKVSEMPARWVLDRCVQDVASTHALFLAQRARLLRSNRLGVLHTRCLLTPVLAAIEPEGMHLDASRVDEVTGEYRLQLAALESDFAATTGGINFRSPKQVAEYLYDKLGFSEPCGRDGRPKRTRTGKRIANKKVLDKLVATTAEQRTFLALKKSLGKVSSALSKNLEYFKEVCDARNGTFHAEFNQAVTATHRLSCTGIKEVSERTVQLQNVPRDFKRLFNAKRDGWLIGEADGAQLEFRVAGHLGNDSQIKRDIRNPEFDSHLTTASVMYGKDYAKLREDYLAGDKKANELRQMAKPITFQPLYGGKGSTKESQRWSEGFRARYHELAKTQEDWVHEVLLNKRLTTPWGLRYYFPRISISAHGFVNNGNAIYNYPIQALATAEIIPIAVAYMWHRIQREGLGSVIIPVSTVHDSVICEIHPDHVDDFKRLAKKSFGEDVAHYLKAVYDIDYSVALGTGIKVATHWGEGKEELYEYLTAKRRG